LIIAKAIFGAVACPRKLSSIHMARTPTIDPPHLKQILIIMSSIEAFAITIDQRDTTIHIANNHRVHQQQAITIVF